MKFKKCLSNKNQSINRLMSNKKYIPEYFIKNSFFHKVKRQA